MSYHIVFAPSRKHFLTHQRIKPEEFKTARYIPSPQFLYGIRDVKKITFIGSLPTKFMSDSHAHYWIQVWLKEAEVVYI